MAGSGEWRCADAFVVNHDGQYRAYVNICPPLTPHGDAIVVRFPVER
jgi:nitrite reductase/ring-hydroxylating ferredoxin subunit